MLEIFLSTAFHWSQLLQPQFYIEHGGLWLILFVVFAETGLFAGLPTPFPVTVFDVELPYPLFATTVTVPVAGP